MSGLFATPCADTLCVVVNGQGYWVRVLNPDAIIEIVRPVPIKQVRVIPQRDLMIFVDFTRLAAYGKEGLRWQTVDVSWDGIEITSVTEKSIVGVGWDAPADRKAVFTVDTTTGLCEGGSSPAKTMP